jgi:hypothetical protein
LLALEAVESSRAPGGEQFKQLGSWLPRGCCPEGAGWFAILCDKRLPSLGDLLICSIALSMRVKPWLQARAWSLFVLILLKHLATSMVFTIAVHSEEGEVILPVRW